MKLKLILTALAVILVFSLLACSSPDVVVRATPAELLTEQKINREIEAKAGDTIEVNLGSNPTTGYHWQTPGISDGTVLEQIGDSEYIIPEEPIPGAGGYEVWSFKALKSGESIITMEYSQPWDGGEKAVWVFTLKVKVE